MMQIMNDSLTDSQALQQLYQVVLEEGAVMDRLIETLEQKQHAIVSGQIEELLVLTAKEQSLVQNSNRLSEKRLRLIEMLLAGTATDAGNLTLTNLISYLHPSVKEGWETLQSELKNALLAVDRLNRMNFRLLKASLHMLEETVAALMPREAGAQLMYDRAGQVDKKKVSSNVVNWQI